MSLQRGINLRALAEKMGQCSGAEVRGICTEAGGCTLLFRELNGPSAKCILQGCTLCENEDNMSHRKTLNLLLQRFVATLPESLSYDSRCWFIGTQKEPGREHIGQ